MGQVKAPIQVLYLITELGTGGAEKLLSQFLAHLNRDQFAPIVACLYGGDSTIAGEIRALGIPVIDLRMTAKWRWDALWRLYCLLRRERPTIIHTSMFHANLTGRVLGRLAGVPIIITWRHSIDIGGALREFVNRWTVQLDDRIVAVCELVRQTEIERARVHPDKVITIYNGIALEDFSADPLTAVRIRQIFDIPPDAPLLGSVGRMHRSKDFSNLLTAIAQVQELVPTVRALLVGDGELRDELVAQAQSLGLSDVVTFAGIRGDVPDILAALDIFVLPSLWEGLPLALLEAMAASLPVVATTVGGVPEVVVDGETGLLVPPQNPQSLAHALLTLLRDPARRCKMGQAGRKRVEKYFTVERMVQQTEALYEDLIGGWPAGCRY